MKKDFLGEDFLLDDALAKRLYRDHAAKMPIFDYHCHLSPKEIYEDRHFKTITEAWLGAKGAGDHYKWRLLRQYGIPEEYITGEKSDWEKFQKWAEAMPYMAGNPVYEWTHLELRTFFGIQEPLSPKNAEAVYEACNEKLKTLSAREMMKHCRVKVCFTTDDPCDDLHYHEAMAEDPTLSVTVLPAFRPDKAIHAENRDAFLSWEKKLEETAGRPLPSLKEFLSALDERLSCFVKHGAKASDHGLDGTVHFRPSTYEEADAVYQKALHGDPLSLEDLDAYQGYLLVHLGREYAHYGMVQEYHIGALRNNSSRMFAKLGPDGGFDGADDLPIAEKLSGLLNALDMTDELPKTVLYSTQEKDYETLMVLANCFSYGEKGKVQMGPAWWFNDCYEGNRSAIERMASDSLLSCSIGMLTDSRSFLSYPRHDYFRRELCQYLSSLVQMGRYPDDEETLGKIVEDVSYSNACRYFGIKE